LFSLFRWNILQIRGLAVSVVILGFIISWYYLKNEKPSFSDHLLQVDSLAINKWDSLRKIYDSLKRPKIYPFYPDYLTDYKAYVLGIDTSALRRIKEFRQSGKRFQSKKHFKEISGISDSLYAVLEPYIRIWQTSPVSKHPSQKNVFKRRTSYKRRIKKDLNKATTEELKKVYGIGDVLSERIVRYREKLGGFTIREQLKDVYGLSQEAYENLWWYFEIKTPKPVPFRIDVNSADMEQLQKNPYIDFDLSEKIVEYRSLHGKFKEMDELKNIPGFPADKYQRIILYLRIK